MKKSIPFLLIVSLLCCASAWAELRENKLNDISLGMKKAQIIDALGQPDATRAEGPGTDGKPVEKLEYSVIRRIDLSKEKDAEDSGQREFNYTCSLVLVDGALVRIERQR